MTISDSLPYVVVFSLLLSGCAEKQSTQQQVHRDLPLTKEADHAYSSKVKKLVAKGTNINQKDKWGRTSLMEAALVNNVSAVKLLTEKGAKVDLKDNGGSTALLIATAGGNTESVRLLLKRKADVNTKGRNGDTPLIVAVDNKNEINKSFPGAGRPVEFFDTIELLLSYGANIHAKRDDGKTALMLAKERDIPQTIALLRKAGARY